MNHYHNHKSCPKPAQSCSCKYPQQRISGRQASCYGRICILWISSFNLVSDNKTLFLTMSSREKRYLDLNAEDWSYLLTVLKICGSFLCFRQMKNKEIWIFNCSIIKSSYYLSSFQLGTMVGTVLVYTGALNLMAQICSSLAKNKIAIAFMFMQHFIQMTHIM